MPGYLATLSSSVMCSHGGKGTPMPPVSRVSVMSVPVMTLAHNYVVAGCALASAGSPPCVAGTFLAGATRVQVALAPGVLSPALVMPASGTCQPTQQPLIGLPTGQARVFAL